MDISIGTVSATKIALGNTEILKVSIGNVLVWPAGVTGGLDLGTETLNATDSDGANRSVSARVAYNSDRTTTLSATATSGGSSSTSAPALNWCPPELATIFKYVSYELLSGGEANSGVLTVGGGIAPSTPAGENRADLSSVVYIIEAAATFSSAESAGGSVVAEVKLSTWDAASGGNRISFGVYDINIAV